MRRTKRYQAPTVAPATPSRSSRLVAKLGDQVDVIIVLIYHEQPVDVGGAGEELENLGFFLQAITVLVVEEEALLDAFPGEGLGDRQQEATIRPRNEKLWLNRSPNPHITFQRAMCLLDDWRQAQPPRNHVGEFVAAKCIPWKGKELVKEAEALGIREALI
nr:hypothetical protein Iba_chr10eCG12570 [Ipomoea batatas]